MIERFQVYKCDICGNIVEVIHAGGGQLVCCNQPMNRLDEKSADSALEKHVPVIEKTDAGILVKVGSVPHPMQDEHYIEWIELHADGQVLKRFLNPGETPEALFQVQADTLTAREYCNVHGLWKS